MTVKLVSVVDNYFKISKNWKAQEKAVGLINKGKIRLKEFMCLNHTICSISNRTCCTAKTLKANPSSCTQFDGFFHRLVYLELVTATPNTKEHC